MNIRAYYGEEGGGELIKTLSTQEQNFTKNSFFLNFIPHMFAIHYPQIRHLAYLEFMFFLLSNINEVEKFIFYIKFKFDNKIIKFDLFNKTSIRYIYERKKI